MTRFRSRCTGMLAGGPRRAALRIVALLGLLLLPAGLRAQQNALGDVRGVVLDRLTGAPLIAARVQLIGTSYFGQTNENGGFFIPEIPAGTYRLTFEHPRAASGEVEADTVEVRVEAGQTTPVRMIARPRPYFGEDPLTQLLADSAFAGVAEPATTSGTIIGRVRDLDSGRGVRGAAVLLRETGERIETDAAGRFTAKVPAGRITLETSMLSYATRIDGVTIPRGRTVEVDLALGQDPVELEPILVEVRAPFLERSGFYARRDDPSVAGRYLERFEIERRVPFDMPDLLRSFPNILIENLEPGRRNIRFRRVAGMPVSDTASPLASMCAPNLYVDGIRLPEDAFITVPPELVAAVEVYDGTDAPLQYGGTTCGVILVWTRR